MKEITIRQYSQLKDTTQYDVLLDFYKPAATITIKGRFKDSRKNMSINKMPYVNVKHCIKLLSNGNETAVIQSLFEICFDVKPSEFGNITMKSFVSARKYMLSEFERVLKTEAKVLAGQNTDAHLWKLAGSDKLKPYNDTLTLLQIGKQFGQYPFDIGRKPYSEVFSLLAQLKVQNEVESEYQKLIMKK